MNSFEIKKTLWFFNFATICALGIIVYIALKQLASPEIKIDNFVYTEPVYSKSATYNFDRVTKKEVETVFGWKEPRKSEILKEKTGDNLDKVKTIEKKLKIEDTFDLQAIIGRLAFVLIKKDNVLKSLLKGDEIYDKNGEVLGVLIEVSADSVLILFDNNIEKLKMDQTNYETKQEADSLVKQTMNSSVNLKIYLTQTPENLNFKNSDNSKNTLNEKPMKTTFDGLAIEILESKDADGVLHRRISEELSAKLQTKEIIKKITNSNNYELVFQANGVLIKNIKDVEAKKIFNALGVTDSDTILSLNGQSLGNTTEDALISLYQQITSSGKYATIEMLKNGERIKFRISSEPTKGINIK